MADLKLVFSIWPLSWRFQVRDFNLEPTGYPVDSQVNSNLFKCKISVRWDRSELFSLQNKVHEIIRSSHCWRFERSILQSSRVTLQRLLSILWVVLTNARRILLSNIAYEYSWPNLGTTPKQERTRLDDPVAKTFTDNWQEFFNFFTNLHKSRMVFAKQMKFNTPDAPESDVAFICILSHGFLCTSLYCSPMPLYKAADTCVFTHCAKATLCESTQFTAL